MQDKLWKTSREIKLKKRKNSSFWLYTGFTCTSVFFFIHWQINLDKWKSFKWQKEPPELFCTKRVFLKILQYYRKTPCWSLFLIKLLVWSLQLYQKETPAQMFSCEYCTNFKNTYSAEQLRRAASIVINKVCVRYFWSNFYFQPNDSPSKTIKNVFYFI